MESDKFVNRYQPSEDESRIHKALARIRGLVGAEDVKAWVERMEHIRPRLVSWRTEPHFPVSHLLFAIDPGNGLSTVMDALHAYLVAAGLFQGDADGFEPFIHREMRMDYSEHLAHNRKEAFALIKDAIEEDGPGLFSLDLSDWLDRFEDVWLQRLLDLCVQQTPKNRFVFVVPMLDEPELERIRKRLADRLPIDLIRFPQPDAAQLSSLLRSRMKAFGLRLPDGADSLQQQWTFRMKSAGRYHGLRTLDNLAKELALAHAAAHPGGLAHDGAEALMDAEVIAAVLQPSGARQEMEARDRLAAMHGIDDLKRQVLEIAQATRLEKEMAQDGQAVAPPCLHMMFTGRPGTGKTELARIVGQLFREEGLLPNGELLEVNRFDLVGQYVGQTGPKTVSACRSAYGSVLFIDEAYLLGVGTETSMGRDYGREAIGALIAEMENNRDRLIVILAGYREEMERFLSVNPGLSARIPHRLHFPSYDRQTLADIFLSMAGEAGTVTDAFREEAAGWFARLPAERLASPHFGNARFARNLAERVQLKALLRLASQAGGQDAAKPGLVFEAVDFHLAAADPDMLRTESTDKRRIGFHDDI